MPTFTEALAATRSSKHRGYRWTPCDPATGCPCTGRLVIDTAKKREEYSLVEIIPSPHYEPGRAFKFVKADGEVYHVFLAVRRELSTCDCAGFTYEATRKSDRRYGQRSDSLGCKHLDTLVSLVWNGW